MVLNMEADIYNSALTPEMDQIIDKVLSQTATDLEFARLTEWLGKDAANRRIFMQQQVIYENMHPAFDPSTVDAEGACRHVARKINRSRWRSAAKISIAALVALVAGVAASVWYFGSRTASETPRMISVTSPHGGVIETELPDGSHVWLNSNSRLDYPVEFQGNERRIALSGEGYFEVKADREHPFIVATQGIEVTATGTAFNVNSYAGKSVGVTLVEGHVNVCDNSKRNFDLYPNEHLSIDNNVVHIARDESLDKWCAWREGLLLFDNYALEDVLERLSQIYPADFVIRDASLAGTRCHASIKGETLSDIVHMLEIGVPMRCVQEKSDSTMRAKIYVYKE